MNHAAWKLFIDASELGSLTKVAEAYRTSQPQISRRIRDLEEACGGKLFKRTSVGVTLTELGLRIAPRVRAIISSTEELLLDLRMSAGEPIGRVRIGSMPSTSHPLMSTVYKVVSQRYPLIQLAIREGQGSQTQAWLEEGSVDIATLYRDDPKARVGEYYLGQSNRYLVGAKGDSLTEKPQVSFSVLDRLPLVLFCRPSDWRNRLDKVAAEEEVSLNVVLEADSASLQARLVSEGGVYALLDRFAKKFERQNLGLQSSRVVSPMLTRHLMLASSRRSESSLAIKTVVATIKDVVARNE